ncbi:DNA primase [Patescibacteria group bacterium]|nr:DNA primase [Patescibacteria group bacterium]
MINVVDEIKSRLDIIDVISEYISVKQVGTSYKAIGPFHHEKTPSFFVSPEKEIWHCFGCDKGGSIFDFLMEIEGIEFPEALRILAQRAGVKIEQSDRRAVSQKTKLLDICRLSARFYHKVLCNSSVAATARQYLKGRGLNQEIITEFELGFVPDKWDTLLKFLIKRGYQEKDIEAAGLIVKSSKSSRAGQQSFYDRFRHRLIFPINDLYGQVIGFTSRVLPGTKDEQASAKYINTPETLIYNKSRVLYGLDKAKLEIKKQDKVILVEGNMDVIAAHQVGDKNIVCTSGTALTENQIKILQRYTQNIILAFDVDLAGQSATQRSIDLLLQQGLNIRILDLPQGKDPDECIRKNPKLWKKALKKPKLIMDYYFSLAFEDKDLKNITQKKEIAKKLLPIIAKLGDPVDQGLWLKKLSDELSISEVFLREAIKKVKLPKIGLKGAEVLIKNRASQEQQAGERFLALILQYPEIGQNFLNRLILDMFVIDQVQTIVREIKDCYSKNQKIDLKKIKIGLKNEAMTGYLDHLLFLVEREFKNYSLKEIEQELDQLFFMLKKRYLNKKMIKSVEELKKEEKQGDKQKIEKITQSIINLSREIID